MSWLDDFSDKNPPRILLLAFGVSALALSPVEATEREWTGGGSNYLWSTPANWMGQDAPVSGDSLTFGGIARISTTNDYAPDTAFAGLKFVSGAGVFTLSGNALALTDDVLNLCTNQVTLDLGLTLAAEQVFDAGVGGLTVSGLNGSGGLTKAGSGALILRGSNNYSGPTKLTAGKLVLDYTVESNSKLSSSAVLTLAGGTVDLVGGASGFTQNVGGLVLQPGLSRISNLSGNISLTLGGITRTNVGGVVVFSNPAVGKLTTSSGSTGGVLGGYALFGAYHWAARGSDYNIKTFTAYTTNNNVGSWGAAQNITDGAEGFSGTLAGDLSINTLRFNGPAASTITLPTITDSGGAVSGKTLTLSAGAVLVTPNVGSNNVTITGGRLGSGTVDLMVHQNNTNGPLTVASDLVGNSTGLTKTGPGTLVLNGKVTLFKYYPELHHQSHQILEGTLAFGSNVMVSMPFNQYIQFAKGTTLQLAAPGNTWVGACCIAGDPTVIGDFKAQGTMQISPGRDGDDGSGQIVFAGSFTNNGTVTFHWDINDASGSAGSDRGWDLIKAAKFNIASATPLWTLTAANLVNFDKSQAYVWPVIQITGATPMTSSDNFGAGNLYGAPGVVFQSINIAPPTRGRFRIDKSADGFSASITYAPLSIGDATNLFGWLDLNQPDLAVVRSNYNAGNYEQALTIYRDVFLNRLSTLNLDSYIPAGGITDAGSPIAIRNSRMNESAQQLFTAVRVQCIDQIASAVRSNPAKAVQDADPIELAYALWLVASIDAEALLNALPPRSSAGLANQSESSAVALLKLQLALPDFTKATGNFLGSGLSTWEYAGSYFYKNLHGALSLGGAANADGTSVEPAMNYQIGLIRSFDTLFKLYGGPTSPLWPGWMDGLERDARDRARFYVGLANSANGGIPGGGRGGQDDGKLDEIATYAAEIRDDFSTKTINLLRHRGDGGYPQGMPVFESATFPYGGHSALRGGWGSNDPWAYLNSRGCLPNSGHFDLGINQVQLAAYGKTILGDWIVDESTAFGHSTVFVDGGGAMDVGSGDDITRIPLQNRWHDSEYVAFGEGSYAGAYGSGTVLASAGDVMHNRQLVLLKDLGLWVVTDRMATTNSHAYSQLWQLAPSYSPAEVQQDLAGKHIWTSDVGAPNLHIYHFGQAPTCSVEVYNGIPGGVSGSNTQLRVDWDAVGNSKLVSLLAPTPDGNNRVIGTPLELSGPGYSGFDASLSASRRASYLASTTGTTVLSNWNVSAVAESLLLCTTNNGAVIHGFALNATTFKVNGLDIMPPVRDFEFTLTGGALTNWKEILTPFDFTWLGGNDQQTVKPSYGDYGVPWSSVIGGNWGDAGNWQNNNVPNLAGEAANFNGRLSANPAIMVDSPVTVGGVHFNNPLASYTVGTPNGFPIILDNVTNGLVAAVTSRGGSHTLAAPVALTGGKLHLIVREPGDVLTLSGTLSGNADVVVGGAGVTSLTASNSFGGRMYLNNGLLRINADAALGNATNAIIFSGNLGGLQIGSDLSSARALEFRGDSTRNFIDVVAGVTGTLNGVLFGKAFSKTGPGTLVLTASNTFTSLGVNGGLVRFTTLTNLGRCTSIDFNGGGVQWAASNTLDLSVGRTLNFLLEGATLDIGSSSVTLANPIGNGGLGGLTKAGTGMLTLNAASSFSGDTIIKAGTLVLGNSFALQSSTLNYDNQGGSIGLGSLSSVTLGALKGGQSLFLPSYCVLSVGANNQDTTYTGVLSGTGAQLIKLGSGTFTLTKPQTHTGGTTISAGTLKLGATNALPSGPILIGAGATLDLNGFNLAVDTLSGAGVVENSSSNPVTLTINQSGSGTFAGIIRNTGGPIRLLKAGSGKLDLVGLQQYTGVTEIQAGTLLVGPDPTATALPVLPNLLLRLDASATSTLVTNASGKVSRWNDASGGSFYAAQATASKQPTLTNNALNQLSVLDFGPYFYGSSSGQSMQFYNASGASLDLNSIGTVFWVLKGYNVLLGDLTTYHFHRGGDDSPTNFIWNASYASANVKNGQTYLNGNTNAINGTTTPLPADYALVSLVTTGPVNAGCLANDRNARTGGQKIAEVLIYGRALTNAERIAVEAYLGRKWLGLTLGSVTNGGGGLPAASQVLVDAVGVWDVNNQNQAVAALSGPAGAQVKLGSLGNNLLTIGGDNTSTSFAGVISGNGGVVKVGAGALTLAGTNTYTGPTIVSNGTLLVVGSLSGTGAVTVVSAGLLGGNGLIGGAVTVKSGATLAPGASLGALTISNILVLDSNSITQVELNKASQRNDTVRGLDGVTYGGTLAVTNLGGTLVPGDAFKIFYSTVYSGSFATISPATPGVSLRWDTTTLQTDGTLRISATLRPVITGCAYSGTGLVLSGTNGTQNGRYYLLCSTNLALPLAHWTRLQTNQFDQNGYFTVTDAAVSSAPVGFYILQIP